MVAQPRRTSEAEHNRDVPRYSNRLLRRSKPEELDRDDPMVKAGFVLPWVCGFSPSELTRAFKLDYGQFFTRANSSYLAIRIKDRHF